MAIYALQMRMAAEYLSNLFKHFRHDKVGTVSEDSLSVKSLKDKQICRFIAAIFHLICFGEIVKWMLHKLTKD